MMVFSPIDDQVYDETATQITYCKLFPYIIEDFLSRDGAVEMMRSSNLPVTTNVTVTPGQVVTVVVPAGTGSTVSPGQGSGAGNTRPIYNGKSKIPADEIKIKQKEAIKNAGGRATEGVLSAALGE